MSSSSSESLASSSTSSILGTTVTGKGKRRRVEFKKKPSHPAEDMLVSNKSVTNTSSSSALSTATVTKKDTLHLSTSTVPFLPPVALSPLPTSTVIDKAAATVYTCPIPDCLLYQPPEPNIYPNIKSMHWLTLKVLLLALLALLAKLPPKSRNKLNKPIQRGRNRN
eukprot:scaffold48127_cov62-Attheya_sp.AAC.3